MHASTRFFSFPAVCGLCLLLLLWGTLNAATLRDIAEGKPTGTQTPSGTQVDWNEVQSQMDQVMAARKQADSPNSLHVLVPNGQTLELFNGDLFLSAYVDPYFGNAQITFGSPDCASQTFYQARTGETYSYDGAGRFEVRVLSIYSNGIDCLVTKGPRSYLVPGIPNVAIFVCLGLVGLLGLLVVVAIIRKPKSARKTASALPPRAPTYQEATVAIADEQQEQVQVKYLLVPRDGGKHLYRRVGVEHWRCLRAGWTEGQVRQLLGAPISIRPAKTPSGEPVSLWAYSRGLWARIRGGTVTFSGGKVLGFTSPPPDYCGYVYHGPNART